MSCLFCSIVSGSVPSHTVHENQQAVAFLDIHPCSPGHTVVIPKAHSLTQLDASLESVAAVMDAVREVTRLLQDRLSADGFNLGWNHGSAGGQAVAHWHVHVIPRYSGDQGGSMHSIVRAKDQPSITEVAKKLIA